MITQLIVIPFRSTPTQIWMQVLPYLPSKGHAKATASCLIDNESWKC